jgi:hypothetical protein
MVQGQTRKPTVDRGFPFLLTDRQPCEVAAHIREVQLPLLQDPRYRVRSGARVFDLRFRQRYHHGPYAAAAANPGQGEGSRAFWA